MRIASRLHSSKAVLLPLCGSSYISTPKKFARREAIGNVKNDDDKCFTCAVLAGLHPVNRKDHPNRVSKYAMFMHELNLDGLRFPMTVDQVGKFEKQNSVGVNVFGYDNKTVFPLHTHQSTIDIGRRQATHMSRLLNDRTKHKGSEFDCNYCLIAFRRQDLLDDHVQYCQPHGPQRTSMPSKDDKWLQFKHLAHQLRVPIVLYADFECCTEPIEACQPTAARLSASHPGFCYHIVSDHPEHTFDPVVYRRPNVVDTSTDKLDFDSATECHICSEDLGADKVRDHCHLTGTYRGADHSECNLQYRFTRATKFGVPSFFIPVVFHNMRGYDSHIIIPAGRHSGDIRCIQKNMEQYMSFFMGQLRFIDSLQFMSMSLEKLVTNLPSDGFTHLEQQSDLLKRKGVYPYDYVDSPARLEDKLNTLGEYHELYMKTDVLLLADIFERFRKTCLYGGAMHEKLAISDFWWLNENEIGDLDVGTVPSESETGYILEVDIEYPNALHDSHSDYPLAPENVCIDATMCSPYTKRLNAGDSKVNKLTHHLHHKTNYVSHYRNIQQYLRLGNEIDKDLPCSRLYSVDIVDALHIKQHRETKGGQLQLRKILFKVTKQCNIWKNNGKS